MESLKLLHCCRLMRLILISTGEHLQQASDGTQCGFDRAEHVGRAIQKVKLAGRCWKYTSSSPSNFPVKGGLSLTSAIFAGIARLQGHNATLRSIDRTKISQRLSADAVDGPASSTALSQMLVLKDGITLGRLLEAFKQVAEGYKTCPHAQPQYHDRYGNVILEHTAVGDLYMDRDDPLALRLRDREHKARNKTRKMEEYCHAKQYANAFSPASIWHDVLATTSPRDEYEDDSKGKHTFGRVSVQQQWQGWLLIICLQRLRIIRIRWIEEVFELDSDMRLGDGSYTGQSFRLTRLAVNMDI
ncbi:hypothetical protein KC322_g127 [Hortaea werneckii]|nr:hypothetical protein KC322_g127 [Hortaea werneckii]